MAEAITQPLLEVRKVTRMFGGLMALDDVSFNVPKAKICGLIGPNGAGKTTLINMISGLVPVSGGEILLNGQVISGLAPHRIAERGIGRTFQNIRLFAELTVLENVMMGHHLKQRGTLLGTLLRLPHSRREEKASFEAALELLRRLRMQHLAHVPARALSYGDQRRVEIARALALEPLLLLLDEPAAGMNSTETAQLTEFLLELNETSLTLLIIEHDMDMIMRMSDLVVVLNFGLKIAEGSPEAIRDERQVIEAYLGEEE
jgi:ABC-type branched-subunit amino acid transport system ATPase component